MRISTIGKYCMDLQSQTSLHNCKTNMVENSTNQGITAVRNSCDKTTRLLGSLSLLKGTTKNLSIMLLDNN